MRPQEGRFARGRSSGSPNRPGSWSLYDPRAGRSRPDRRTPLPSPTEPRGARPRTHELNATHPKALWKHSAGVDARQRFRHADGLLASVELEGLLDLELHAARNVVHGQQLGSHAHPGIDWHGRREANPFVAVVEPERHVADAEHRV